MDYDFVSLHVARHGATGDTQIGFFLGKLVPFCVTRQSVALCKYPLRTIYTKHEFHVAVCRATTIRFFAKWCRAMSQSDKI
jgi:hypothetical protein